MPEKKAEIAKDKKATSVAKTKVAKEKKIIR